jgi:hypothetical protein
MFSAALVSHQCGGLLVALMAVACAGEHASEIEDNVPTPTALGVIDEGFVRAARDLDWGSINGIAVSARGEIAVADRARHRTTILSSTGHLRLVIGREGSEPGALLLPCCLAFGPGGELWIREGGNSRYSVFRLDGQRPVFDHTLPIEHASARAWALTTFDHGGRLIDVETEVDDASGGVTTIRFHRDPSSGKIRERDVIPEPPADKLGSFVINRRIGDRTTRQYFYAPYAPEHLVAHAPGGSWAHAISSSYVVSWRNQRGDLIQTLRLDVAGPALSRGEQAEATRYLKEQTARAGRKLPFAVPLRKPPLRALFFDAAGRLWVERTRPVGSDRLADVYDENGRLVDVVAWPSHIRLDVGFVQRDFALGVERNDLDVERLVRLRFQTGATDGVAVAR